MVRHPPSARLSPGIKPSTRYEELLVAFYEAVSSRFPRADAAVAYGAVGVMEAGSCACG